MGASHNRFNLWPRTSAEVDGVSCLRCYRFIQLALVAMLLALFLA